MAIGASIDSKGLGRTDSLTTSSSRVPEWLLLSPPYALSVREGALDRFDTLLRLAEGLEGLTIDYIRPTAIQVSR